MKEKKSQVEIKKLKEELNEYKKQAEENLNGWKRAQADFVNFKKEQEKRVQELSNFVRGGLILEFLPVVDNFELALEHLPQELVEDQWVEGIKNIKKQLEVLLKNSGIKKIKIMGEKFDPKLHEAIAKEKSDEESDIIIKEVQAGYLMKDKVLRPAKVVISE